MTEKSIWYEATPRVFHIRPVTVVKTTPTRITKEESWGEKTHQHVVAKQSSYSCYYPTWEEAHEHLKADCARRLDKADRALKQALADCAAVAKMERP